MVDMIRPVAFLGGTAALILCVRDVMSRTPGHPLVTARESLKAHHALQAALSDIANVADAEKMNQLLDEVEASLRADDKGGAASQWVIARTNSKAVRLASSVCDTRQHVRNEKMFRTALLAQEDAVPRLTGLLDNILHNNMLRHRSA